MSSKGCTAFYAVRRGRSPGVYSTWRECEAQVKGFKSPAFRKFLTKEEAWDFVNGKSPSSSNGKRKHSESSDNPEVSSSNSIPKSLKVDTGDISAAKTKEFGDTVVVYTDGASSSNGYHGAQAGIGVYWGPDHPLNTSKRLPGRQTNNRAEIHAAVHALRQAKEIGARNVKLYTDSQFLIKGITNWIHNWKKNGWKLSGSGGPVKNKEDFQELEAAAEGLNVEWVYVKGHDGNDGNVQADKLAVAGSQKPLEAVLDDSAVFCNVLQKFPESSGKLKNLEGSSSQEVDSSSNILKSLKTDSGDTSVAKNTEFWDTVSRFADGATSCNKYSIQKRAPPSTNQTLYAVRRGRSPGVFNTWSECEAQVKGFKGAAYKKFLSKEEAWDFVNGEKSLSCSVGKHEPSESSKSQEVNSGNSISKSEFGDIVVVYTDGASSCNGYHGAQAGIGVYWGPDHPLNTSKRLPGRQTNNRAEIHAAVHALRQAKEIGARNVKLYTDSKFLIKGITEWIHKWKKNGWKLSGNGGPVINKEDFEELEAAAQGLNVEWVYVKGHDGNDGNDQADKLAVAGARKPLEDGASDKLAAKVDLASKFNVEFSDLQDEPSVHEEEKSSEPTEKVTSSRENFANESTGGYVSQVESGDTLLVYVDGTSCNYGFSGPQAGVGVYWGPDHPLNTSKKLSGPRQTNNRAKILAAAHALRQAKEIGAKNIKVHSDSNFLIKGITQWIRRWKRNGWKLSGTGGPVINKEDFEELDAAREGLNVEWVYVKTQDENHGNAYASKLAIAGTKKSAKESES